MRSRVFWQESRRQLILNSDIAALIRKCGTALGEGEGSVGSESAMVEAGIVSRQAAQEAVDVKVLVQDFVVGQELAKTR